MLLHCCVGSAAPRWRGPPLGVAALYYHRDLSAPGGAGGGGSDAEAAVVVSAAALRTGGGGGGGRSDAAAALVSETGLRRTNGGEVRFKQQANKVPSPKQGHNCKQNQEARIELVGKTAGASNRRTIPNDNKHEFGGEEPVAEADAGFRNVYQLIHSLETGLTDSCSQESFRSVHGHDPAIAMIQPVPNSLPYKQGCGSGLRLTGSLYIVRKS